MTPRFVLARGSILVALSVLAHASHFGNARAASALSKLDPLFRIQLPRPTFSAAGTPSSPLQLLPPDSTLTGIVEFNGNAADVRAAGARVGTQAGNLFTVRLTPPVLAALLEDPRCLAFEGARPGRATLHTSGAAIGSPKIHAPTTHFPGGIRGQGVLVGILDSGLDTRHDDFRDTAGRNRIRAVWDMYGEGTPPSGFGYGRLWTEPDVEAAAVTEADYFGHGTLVAGIAAGSGLATGHGYPQFYEVGVAPAADIAAVKTTYLSGFESQSNSWIDGLKFLFDLAAARGEDAVVNLSYGGQWGPHDGTSRTERLLSSLTGPGRILVVSAGNDAQRKLHSSVACRAGDSVDVKFTIPPYVPSGELGEDRLVLEAWADRDIDASIELRSAESVLGPVTPGHIAIKPWARLLVGGLYPSLPGGAHGADANRSFTIAMQTDRCDCPFFTFVTPSPGTYTIRILRPSQETHFDLWIDSPYFTDILPTPTFDTPDSATTLTAPGTCDSCITVGSFVTADSWTDSLGAPHTYQQLGIPVRAIGSLSDFSGRGPRRDGLARPDLAAPGQAIASSLSRDSRILPARTLDDGAHAVFEGTSLAAPQVTGAVALLLQIQPHLPPARVRDILRRAAKRDAEVHSGSAGDWGAGKLSVGNLFEAVAATDFGPAARTLQIAHARNPASGPVTFQLRSEVARAAARLEIFEASGRRVHLRDLGSLGAGQILASWDPAAAHLPAGVYFARFSAGGATAFDRIQWLR